MHRDLNFIVDTPSLIHFSNRTLKTRTMTAFLQVDVSINKSKGYHDVGFDTASGLRLDATTVPDNITPSRFQTNEPSGFSNACTGQSITSVLPRRSFRRSLVCVSRITEVAGIPMKRQSPTSSPDHLSSWTLKGGGQAKLTLYFTCNFAEHSQPHSQLNLDDQTTPPPWALISILRHATVPSSLSQEPSGFGTISRQGGGEQCRVNGFRQIIL